MFGRQCSILVKYYINLKCSSKQNPDKEIIMESSLGGVQGAMQINAQKPGGRLSCKFHLTLFWDGRRIKSCYSEDRTIHTDKLVPLPLTEELNLFIILQVSIFQGSLCVLLSLFTPFLPSLDSATLRTPSSICVKRQVSLIRRYKKRRMNSVSSCSFQIIRDLSVYMVIQFW